MRKTLILSCTEFDFSEARELGTVATSYAVVGTENTEDTGSGALRDIQNNLCTVAAAPNIRFFRSC